MIKPIELLGAAHRRLALRAGARAATLWMAPALAVIVLGILLGPIGSITWGRLGYQLPALGALRAVILIVGLAMLAAGVIRGWLAWRATGFVDAAAEVDDAVDGHQEVLTLAALSDADGPGGESDENRGALFPLLWRRVTAMLESFDPDVFGLDLGEPLKRSSGAVAAAIAIIALATLAMVRQITPDQAAAGRLIDLAREMANTENGNGAAQEVIAATERIESSKLPPEQKLQQLADLTRQLQDQMPQQKQEQKHPPSGAKPHNQSASNQGSNNQSGKSSAGSGSGKGEAKNGQGDGGKGGGGKGQGPGNGSGSGSSKGTGQDQNGQQNANANPKPDQNQNQKTNQQLAELQDQIKKAQAQIQAEHANNPGPGNLSGGKNKGSAVRPDKNGDQRLAAANQNGKGGNQMNQPGQGGKRNPNGPKPGSSPGTTPGGTQGDTHLGEFPAPVAYQHYYLPGEHGLPLAIHDARYVLFRLPEAIAAPKGGKLIVDSGGPHATTPYVNVPLNESRPLEVAPNEQQLVPPRYRDLIR